MTMTKVKICGLQSVEVLKSMVHLPVDYAGFVFAPSKRQVSPEQASAFVAYLQEERQAGREKVPQAIGVFVNPTPEQLQAVMDQASLNGIQLHGAETPEFCRWVRSEYGVPVIKALAIQQASVQASGQVSGQASEQASEWASGQVSGQASEQAWELAAQDKVLSSATMELLDSYRDVIDILLIDTYDPLYGGGSGRTFRWEVIPAYQDWASRNGIELFVAGGLHADNIAGLLRQYSPAGVDVSSGVETDGIKNINKITAFVERVKQREHFTG